MFKAWYLCTTFAGAVETLREFWKGFNILNAIQNITAKWEEITQQNTIWKTVLKTNVNTFKVFNEDPTVDAVINNKTLVLVKWLELNTDEEDIHMPVDTETKELSNEELIWLE